MRTPKSLKMKVPEIAIKQWQDGYGAFSNRMFNVGEVVEVSPVKIISTVRSRLPNEIKTITYSYDGLVGSSISNGSAKARKIPMRKWFATQANKVQWLKAAINAVWPKKRQKLVVSLGYGSMYNHSDTPNLRYELSCEEDRMYFIAIRDIGECEQLTISYYHPAGEVIPTDRDGLDWFARNGIKKITIS